MRILLAVLALWPVAGLADDVVVTLRPGTAQIVQLPRSFASVVVGNEDMIDVTPRSDRNLSVVAKDVIGSTNLLVLDDMGTVIANIGVLVSNPPRPGRVFIHSKPGDVHNYFAYECGDKGCVRVEDKFERDAPPPTGPGLTIITNSTTQSTVTPRPNASSRPQ